MNKFSPHLKLVTILVLVLSMGFLSVSQSNMTFAEGSSLSKGSIDIKTEVIDKNTINNVTNNVVIPTLNATKINSIRESVSKIPFAVHGYDRLINNQMSQFSTQVPSAPTIENLCNGETIVSVGTATDLISKLSDSTTKCIRLTANITINLRYSISNNPASPNVNLLRDKVILNNASYRITVETSSGDISSYKKTFINGQLHSLSIFDTEINYVGYDYLLGTIAGHSNISLFSNLNDLTLINTRVKSANTSLGGDYNYNTLIGPVTNLSMYNTSLITSIGSRYTVINAGTINVLESSTINVSTSNASSIESSGNLSIYNSSVVTANSIYSDIGGSTIKVGGNLYISNSTINTNAETVANLGLKAVEVNNKMYIYRSTMNLKVHGITDQVHYGLVLKGADGALNAPSVSTIEGNSTISISRENTSTNSLVGIFLPQSNTHLAVSNSTVNSIVSSNSIKSTGTQNVISLTNATTFNHTGTSTAIHIGEANENATLTIDNAKLQMRTDASAFIGHNLVLSNGGKITQDSTVTYTIANPYIRANSFVMSGGLDNGKNEIILRTNKESFLKGLGEQHTDTKLTNGNLNVKFIGNIGFFDSLNSHTNAIANISNLEIENTDIKIEHHGNRTYFINLFGYKGSSTIGFANISGDVSIIGGTNNLTLMKYTNSGDTESYITEGFMAENEHTFLRMMSDGDYSISNSIVNYKSNVSFLSTNKNISLNLANATLNADMAESSQNYASHSFISIRDGLGKIDIELDKSVLQIVHKSDYVYNSGNIRNSTKPTISLFDHVGLSDSALPNINLNANDSTISVRDITVSNFTTLDADNTVVADQKLSPSAIPLEINSIELTNNSNFSYYNNHALYPLIRSKDFKAINSNVTFEKSGVYHVKSSNDSSLPSTSNYSHIMYDMIADTKFSFLLDSSASNYKGALLKFLTSSNRNVLNKYLITNGNSNITAKIEYFNITTYGGSDSGKEFNRTLLFNSVDKGTSILTGTSSLNIARNQTEESSQMSKYNLNPTLSSPVLESTLNVFDVSINRRKNIIIGDFYVELESILEYDSATQKNYIVGYATPGTVIMYGSNLVSFDQTLEPNGLAKFRYEYSDSETGEYTFKAFFRVKEGGDLNNQSDNAPDLNFTRYYSVQPSLGELKLTTEGNLDFGNKTLDSQTSYVDRITGTNFIINISDTRRNSPGWVLELCVESEFKTTLNQNQLPMFNDLSYKDTNNTYVDLKGGCVDKVVIARSDTDNALSKSITWQHNQGLQLHITNPWLIISGSQYTASIKFSLISSDVYDPTGP